MIRGRAGSVCKRLVVSFSALCYRDAMTLAIETQQLTRYFNDFCAVSGIDLAVERGPFYGFLAPNGAGQSDTIKMQTGPRAPSRGHIRLLGRDTFAPRRGLDAHRRLAVVP